MSSRWVRFILVILIGIVAGLYYGWVVNPVKYVDAPPDTLRIDFKSDYALMVAEAYSQGHDLATAQQRLALFSASPVDLVNQAIVFGQGHGYAEQDLLEMRSLLEALQHASGLTETPGP
jgi:hypothetical protein